MSSLVIGIVAIIFLFLWVEYELNYNRTMPDRERVYALMTNDLVEGEIITEEGNNVPLMDFFTHEVGEIESVTRIDNSRALLGHKERTIQKQGIYADTSFFNVHPAKILAGSAVKPLPDNHSIALSKELADLLFVNGDAIGKTVTIDRDVEFAVSAVYNSFPVNSDFNYIKYVLPYHSKERETNEWTNYDIKLVNPDTRVQVEQKTDQKLAQLIGNTNSKAFLFPLSDWRLHWSFVNGKSSGGRIVYLVIFSITGLFVLLMACINYMNIATARATRRTREIGVRKMTGATQQGLIRQFMAESLLFTSIAALVSLLLAYLLLPYFNELVGVKLSFLFNDPLLWIGLACISLFTTVMAGSYPAFLLSSFKPAAVLKGNLHTTISGTGLRKALVVFQFALSVIIIFCSWVMWQHTDYLLTKEVGYDKHRVINVWLDRDQHFSLHDMRSSILNHSIVEAAAMSGASPMEINGYASCNRVGAPLAAPLSFYGVNIDENVLPALNFKLVQGRNFSATRPSDSSAFIITQKAADLLGLKNPVGEQISFDMFGQQQGEIIGVIADFQNDDIHTAEKPVVFVFGKPQYLGNLFVRYQKDKHEEALAHVKNVFQKFQPDIPLNFSFLDEDFENQLYREKQLSRMSIAYTIIAVAIAALGLYGLVLFTTQRRTKEVGIRKVLGASVPQVLIMLCRDFISPIVYSLIIAFPVAYYLMQQFLEGYASRVVISINSFVLVGAALVVMVLITISYQSLKAATQNPTDSLKTE